MTNISKPINEWDIETIEKRLTFIQGAADGDCRFLHSNGMEILEIAQQAAKLVRLEEKYRQPLGEVNPGLFGWKR